jgi:hypothetical protein
MTNSIRFLVLAMGLTMAPAGTVPAALPQSYNQTDQRILTLLDRLNTDARTFDRLVDNAMGQRGSAAMNDDVDQLVNELTDTTRHLREHVTRRAVVDNDVQEVLIRGARIDEFMRRHQLSGQVENSWLTVRRELDELAQAFHVTWNWQNPNMRPSPGPAYYSQLSGTYRLDPARSDDVNRIATQATRALPAADRDRVHENLVARLEAPTMLSIDRNGRTVSIASEKAPRGTFDIDGVPRSETGPNGGTSTVRASLYGDQLAVTTTGNRGRDFTVTFDPLESGNGLEVVRSIEVASLTSPVMARSVYRRTSNQPDWNLYRDAPVPARGNAPRGNAAVPYGTVLTAHLNTPLGSRTSKQGDRFTMTVDSPAAYRGATLEGVVTRVNTGGGRNELIFDFDQIRTRDGRTQQFAATLNEVRTPNGKVINIDEGSVRTGSSRTTETVQGGAVGATIGAIIGAIAGGGKGAAIGAAVGAGAGAGTLYTVGSSIDLPVGTEVQLVAQPNLQARR